MKMKRRDLEEEVQTLAARFDAVVKLLPAKAALPILKQIEVLQRRVRPKQHVKGSALKNQNSGLLKPVRVSKCMAEFAGWDADALHSRVDVTKAICDYIKKHSLQKPSNKKTILPDTALQTLLSWNDADEQATAVVTSVKADAITFRIQTPADAGRRPASYYNNADLTAEDGTFIANIKKLTRAAAAEGEGAAEGDSAGRDEVDGKDGVFCAVLDRAHDVVQERATVLLKASLTYPKIQTRISVHLAESVNKLKTKKSPTTPLTSDDSDLKTGRGPGRKTTRRAKPEEDKTVECVTTHSQESAPVPVKTKQKKSAKQNEACSESTKKPRPKKGEKAKAVGGEAQDAEAQA
jgi:hypothetical protein